MVEQGKPEAVEKRGERKPLFVLLRQREAGAVVLIENTEFHDEHPCWSRPVEARLDWCAGPDMQLKQIVLGVSERRDNAVRTHVATRKVSPSKPLDPLRERSQIDRPQTHSRCRAP